MYRLLLKVTALLAICTQSYSDAKREFTVDYENNTFLKDGQPFRYISGSIHYSRVPAALWRDRLTKMFAAGLDAIQVYIPWNVHEPLPGVFDFSGQNDLLKFLGLAQEIGLLVILRPGPFICAEWEFGGLPWWLLSGNTTVITRTMDTVYISAVDKWLAVLLPKISPLLYINGGPIITVQVENEYGSYFACDRQYMSFLRSRLIQFLGTGVVLFTTDGNGLGYLKCGALNGTLTTVDFGIGNAANAFKPLQQWQPHGPLVNSEFYVGWLDIWGQQHSTTDTADIVMTLDQMIRLNASVNMYMFHGGTNFGFHSGAPSDTPFLPVPTSYDYDAPISEAGDTGFKYDAIRSLLAKHKGLPNITVPANSTKVAYGSLNLTFVSTISDCLDFIQTGSTASQYPLTQEQVGQGYGLTAYLHVVENDYTSSQLSVPGIRDMGYVTVNGQIQGILDRTEATTIAITASRNETLSILVENQGRVGYGSGINRNLKGIVGNVTLGGLILQNWTTVSLDLSQATKCPSRSPFPPSQVLLPSVYVGQLRLSVIGDTFLRLDGWHKGLAFINGFNLGRYWPLKGPQVTLYVPSTVLTLGINTITIVELEAAPCADDDGSSGGTASTCSVQFVSEPVLNGPVYDAARLRKMAHALD